MKYHLTEEEVSIKITDRHIVDISISLCTKWKFLPAYLGLAANIAQDIDCKPVNEEEKRLKFLTTWKVKKGFEATYKSLIGALLDIECRDEAGSVCELLKSTPQQNQLQQQQQQYVTEASAGSLSGINRNMLIGHQY